MLRSPQVELPAVTIEHHYNTTAYIPYAVPFIPVAYPFHSWKPVSPISLDLFCPTPSLLPFGNFQICSRRKTNSWQQVTKLNKATLRGVIIVEREKANMKTKKNPKQKNPLLMCLLPPLIIGLGFLYSSLFKDLMFSLKR